MKQKILQLQDNSDLSSSDRALLKSLIKNYPWDGMQEHFAWKLIQKYGKRTATERTQSQGAKELKTTRTLPDKYYKPKATYKAETNHRHIFVSMASHDQKLYKRIKNIPGSEFDNLQKKFTFPLNLYTIEVLENSGVKLSDDIQIWREKQENIEIEIKEEMSPELFPFQVEGVKLLQKLNGRALLSDSCGLGKTAQAINYLKINPQNRPALIICPASLKLNWLKELKELWGINEDIFVVNGKKSNIPNVPIIIINYDILYNYIEMLENIDFNTVIIDESHKIKNRSTNRARAVKYLCKNIKHIICISATPVVNRPSELFTTLNLLDSELFSSEQKYLNRYCNALKDPSGKGHSNIEELHKVLTSTFMIRRIKEEVMKDLPPKIHSVIPMEIRNRDEYEYARKDLISYIRENFGKDAARRASYAEAVVRFEKLKSLAVQGKIDAAIEWIGDVIESGEKLVVFTSHKFALETLMEKFKDVAVCIDGSTSNRQRQKNVEQFQADDKIRLFVGQYLSAGVGITLTASSNVAFLELPWTSGDLIQCCDRCHRIGSKAESINIWYLIADNTVENDIMTIIDKKAKVLSQILNGEEVDSDTLLTELIKKYSE